MVQDGGNTAAVRRAGLPQQVHAYTAALADPPVLLVLALLVKEAAAATPTTTAQQEQQQEQQPHISAGVAALAPAASACRTPAAATARPALALDTAAQHLPAHC